MALAILESTGETLGSIREKINQNFSELGEGGSVLDGLDIPEFSGGSLNEVLAHLAVLDAGRIKIRKRNGETTYHGLTAETDLERGNELQDALESVEDGDTVTIGSGEYLMRELGLKLNTNASYLSLNARLYIDGQSAHTGDLDGDEALSLLFADSPFNLNVMGSLTLDGAGLVKFGLLIQSAQNTRISNVSFMNWGSRGFWATGSTIDSKGLIVDKCYAQGCNVAFDVFSEYVTLHSCVAYQNSIGMSSRGGNATWSVCTSTYNGTNFRLRPTNNGGHGMAIGCHFNHATEHNLLVQANFVLGFTFSGCHFYDAESDIDLAGSGVSFIGGDIACPVVSTSPLTGNVDMNGVHFNRVGSSAANLLAGLSVEDRKRVKIYNCKDQNQECLENEQPIIIYNEYANNAAAVAAGLVIGQHYRITGTGQIMIVIA